MSLYTFNRNKLSVVCLSLFLTIIQPNLSNLSSHEQSTSEQKPKLRLRSTPKIGFAPIEILFIGELQGGEDNYEEFYCPTVEWDWDDDTVSSSTPDCDPYEPNRSTIRRHFFIRHKFNYSGRYEVRLNLKKGRDIVASSQTMIQLQGRGLR